MNNGSTSTGAAQSGAPVQFEYRVVDLGKFLRIFWKRRLLILACSILGGAAGAGAVLLVHPQFDATVTLMPPSRTASLIESLSPSRNEGDLYLGLLTSRTVADDVIAHQHLAEYFHLKKNSYVRSALADMAKISVDKNQFLTVTVRAKEPETALRVANEFPQALYRLNHAVALEQAEHRLDYLTGPLEEEKNRLAAAEDLLKRAQQKTGIVQPEAQIQIGLTSIAALKQRTDTLNEQLASILPGSTDQNPQVVSLRAQIGAATAQLRNMEAQNGGPGTAPSKASTPELTLEIDRLAREVRFHQGLMDVLSKQYENARFDESYSPPVELVDSAVLPDQKSWPPRKLFALIGLLLGTCFGLILAWLFR